LGKIFSISEIITPTPRSLHDWIVEKKEFGTGELRKYGLKEKRN
jgi:hypothetical protein